MAYKICLEYVPSTLLYYLGHAFIHIKKQKHFKGFMLHLVFRKLTLRLLLPASGKVVIPKFLFFNLPVFPHFLRNNPRKNKDQRIEQGINCCNNHLVILGPVIAVVDALV